MSDKVQLLLLLSGNIRVDDGNKLHSDGLADEGKRNSEIPGGRFYDGRIPVDDPVGDRPLHNVKGRSVLDTAEQVLELQLCVQIAIGKVKLEKPRSPDKTAKR
jgi:hypothetical protein